MTAPLRSLNARDQLLFIAIDKLDTVMFDGSRSANLRDPKNDGRTPLIGLASGSFVEEPNSAERERKECGGYIWDWLLPVSDVNARDAHGATALMVAARNGNSDVVRALLTFSDFTAQESGGNTALHQAVRGRNLISLQPLIPRVDDNVANGQGITPLMACAKSGWAAAVRLLLAVSNVSLRDKEAETAFERALSSANEKYVDLSGDEDCVDLLASAMATSALDEKGRTLLMQAGTGNLPGATEVLLRHSNPNAQAHDGSTALMLGMLRKAANSVLVPLAKKTAARMVNNEGLTAHAMATAGHTEELLKALSSTASDAEFEKMLFLNARRAGSEMAARLEGFLLRQAISGAAFPRRWSERRGEEGEFRRSEHRCATLPSAFSSGFVKVLPRA